MEVRIKSPNTRDEMHATTILSYANKFQEDIFKARRSPG